MGHSFCSSRDDGGAHGGENKLRPLSYQTYVAVMVIKHIVIQSHSSSTALLKQSQTTRGQNEYKLMLRER